MNIANLILGAIVLLFGRSLFWVFVAIVGFLVGMEIGQQLAANQAAGMQILIGLGLGVVGALVAIFAQRLGFAIAGFYAGGYLGVAADQSIALPSEPMVWFVIGGVIGALVAFVLMDWAIIVLSSFVGAGAITAALAPESTTSAILFIVLAAIGIIFQGRRLQGPPASTPSQGEPAA
jgi:Domain of unknown function (DUF4203)